MLVTSRFYIARWRQLKPRSKRNFLILTRYYAPSACLVLRIIVADIPVGLLSARHFLPFLPLIRCPPNALLRLIFPVPVILTLLLSPLWVFCLGIFSFLLVLVRWWARPTLPYFCFYRVCKLVAHPTANWWARPILISFRFLVLYLLFYLPVLFPVRLLVLFPVELAVE